MHFKITTAGKAAAIRPTDNSDSYINNSVNYPLSSLHTDHTDTM